jgi:hypothetical protein
MQFPIQSQKPETPDERNLRIVSEQGVPHAAAIVEILRPFDQQTLAGPMPFALVGGEVLPLASAVAKYREQNPGLGRLFDPNGKLDYRKMTPKAYQAIRRHAPELLGLKPIGQRW